MALAAFFISTAQAADGPVYELRIYTANEGKLPDVLKRFREHTCEIFTRHGIENIGYWTPISKEDGADNTLIYVIRHKSRDAAKENWAAFSKDPEWQKVRAASEENGKLLTKAPESIYMTPTDFSPDISKSINAIALTSTTASNSGGSTIVGKGTLTVGGSDSLRTFEFRTYHTPEGKLPALLTRFRDHTMKLFEKHGMTNLGYFTPMDTEKGSADTLIYFLAHPSKEQADKNFAAFRADADWVKVKKESEKDGPLTLPQPDGVKSIFMKPTDFSPIK
jgi:hypothetical protein